MTLRGNSIDRDNIGFMFKKKADTDFQRYDATIYNEQTGDFSLLLIENIMPGTEYEYYACLLYTSRSADVVIGAMRYINTRHR